MPIWTTYAIGIVAIVLVMAAWVAVQGAWRRAFPGYSSDPDVLAGRTDCHSCGRVGCRHSCEGADPAEEEIA
jgi:hypothetical protein